MSKACTSRAKPSRPSAATLGARWRICSKVTAPAKSMLKSSHTLGARRHRGVTDFGKTVRNKLSEAGGAFLRRGKGDHDIWTTREGKRIVVPVRVKSRHTANGILKDAGLPKAL